MRFLFVLLFPALSFLNAAGQYYYDDIIATNETNAIYAVLQANKVSQVSAVNIGYDNVPDNDFIYRRKIQGSGGVIVTETKIAQGTKTISTAYYRNNKIAKVTDSSDKVLTTTLYAYNDKGGLSSISIETDDDFMNSHLEEMHLWHYNETGVPDYLTVIKNKRDTTLVNFIQDQQGNDGEERWQKKGRRIETYYYYYNAKNQLTDVVRFNLKAQRMLPDFLFEYDDAGHVIQTIQVLQGSSDYAVWQYLYGADGLKQKDVLLDKQRQLLGRIEYSYK